jgi:hypothetical protein
MINWTGLVTAQDKIAAEKKLKQDLINQESLKYLTETDWYVTRKQETGVDIPEDILTKRQAARDKVK